jgi:MFS family permease
VASQTYATGIGTAADRARITGRFSFATNVSALLAPLLIGGVAQVVGYQTGFAFIGAFALLHVVTGLLLPDARPAKQAASRGASGLGGFREAQVQLRERSTQVALILTFVRIWVMNGWTAFFPLFLEQRGFAPVFIGTILSANGIVSAITGLWASWFARRSSNEVATAGALALGGLGVALSPHVLVFPLIYLPAAFMGSGTGLSMPMVMAILGNAVPPERRGVAMGLRTTGNQLATVAAPMVLGSLVQLAGVVFAFAMSGALAWAMLAAAMALHFGERRPSLLRRAL